MGSYRWNTDRIAEVWLGDYLRYYYRTTGDTKNRNYGDISERLEIKKKIGCKSFDWFVKNVYPKVPIPDNIRDPTTTTSTTTPMTTTTSLTSTTAKTVQTTTAQVIQVNNQPNDDKKQ